MTVQELINLINVRYKAFTSGKGTADNLIDKYKAITCINFLDESIVINESLEPEMIDYLYWHIPNGSGMMDDVNEDGAIDEQDEDALDDIFSDVTPETKELEELEKDDEQIEEDI